MMGNSIRIEKGKRRLLVIAENGLTLHDFVIGLGSCPVGHKNFQGDGKTPEGNYIIVVKNKKSKFFLSLGLNYPNCQDACIALQKGILSALQAEAISKADEFGQIPPWDTPLGGEIYIHGGGCHEDWTAGCIALANEDIKILFDMAEIGTRVEILS